MNMRKYLFCVLLVFLCLFGLCLNTVQADDWLELDFRSNYTYRYDSNSSWQNLPLENATVGHIYQIRLQCSPYGYEFVQGHFYDLKITVNHSYGNWIFDSTTFTNLNNQNILVNPDTLSYASSQLDYLNNQVVVSGVSDADVNKVLQRIRFFFNCEALQSPDYTSANIRMGQVHLYVKDSTEKYASLEIANKLDDTNDKLDETNDKLDTNNSLLGSIISKAQSIIDAILDLPNTLRTMLYNFFVPTDAQLQSHYTNFIALLGDRFGAVFQVFNYLVIFAGLFVSGTASGTFYVPELSVDIPVILGQTGEMIHFEIYHGGNIELLPHANTYFEGTFLDAIKFGIDIIAIVLFINFLIKVFHGLFMPQESEVLEDGGMDGIEYDDYRSFWGRHDFDSYF